MLRIGLPTAPPPTQDAPPDLAQTPDGPATPKYDVDKVSPDVARYQGPGSTCSACQFFEGQNSCTIVSGPIDPDGYCSIFTPQDDQQDTSDDGSDQLSQPPSPDGLPNA